MAAAMLAVPLTATRYVQALREGGSVPAIVEADDGGLWVAKFRGSAQGGRVLAAELIVGELARAAGLRIPELGVIEIDAALGRSEPHQEIRETMLASAGVNLAMGYLSGALAYDPATRRPVAGDVASKIVVLDVLAANVDRTARNTNLLWWRDDLWVIDNGASLFWHHGWDGADGEAALLASAARPFARVGDHVLLPFADQLPATAEALAAAWDAATVGRAVAAVPDLWLDGPGGEKLREAYSVWLRARIAALPTLIAEANGVRAARV
jgi:hypothetical protein